MPRLPVLLTLAMLALSACGTSPKPNFYTLESDPTAASNVAGAAFIVALGPVMVPDVVDRPQIVTRNGSNQITINEFDTQSGTLFGHANAAGAAAVGAASYRNTREFGVFPPLLEPFSSAGSTRSSSTRPRRRSSPIPISASSSRPMTNLPAA